MGSVDGPGCLQTTPSLHFLPSYSAVRENEGNLPVAVGGPGSPGSKYTSIDSQKGIGSWSECFID